MRKTIQILDGGMISEVAKRIGLLQNGVSHLRGWSIRPLFNIENNNEITKMHREYLDAGADLLQTASYNVSDKALDTLELSLPGGAEVLFDRAISCALAAGAKPGQIAV